jgi:peptide/nickel transport system substrate-binding protein
MRGTGMTGRDFTRTAAAACACAIAISTLSGCRQSGQAAAAAAIADRANEWTVPGVLRIEADSSPDSLNPLLGQISIDTDLSMFWAGHFFNWSDDGKQVPDLATEVPTQQNGGISKDGRTITYHLRRGVRWQDGATFGADDVIFTWHAIMNPRNDVPVREGYDLITSIAAPDSQTVVVHLKRPYAPFITTFFAMSSTAYAVLPKHLLGRYRDLNSVAYNRMPVGTGPFRVVSNDGKRVRLLANPSYWRGAPKLKEVDFHWESNDATILQHLKQHQIDFYYSAYERQEPELHGIPGTTIYLYPFNGFEDVGFNTSSPVVSDKRVRQALAYALDRSEVVNTIANGVNAAADTDQAPFSWAHDNHVKQYSFDPRAARALLDQAGWTVGPHGIRIKDGKRLRIRLTAGGGIMPTGPMERLIQTNWRAVGADVVIENYSDVKLFAPAAQGGIEATGGFDAVVEGWVNGVDPDDSTQFMCGMSPPAGWNIYRYCNKQLDASENEALSSYDQATRRRAYHKIQATIAEDVPIIVLFFQQQQDVVNLDLKNYRPASAVTPFWNTWQFDI